MNTPRLPSLLVLVLAASVMDGTCGPADTGTGNPDPITTGGGSAGSSGGGTCTLGTPDACGSCSVSCPGPDDARTQRTCSSATASGQCGITCLGNAYDVNGDVNDGCEAVDNDGAGHTIATARAFNLASANPLNFTAGALLSDTRLHADAPTSRVWPTADVYSLTAPNSGNGDQLSVVACLGIPSLPSDNEFQICITDANAASFSSANCGQAHGGESASQCVAPPDGSTRGGPFFIQITKLTGSRSPDKYALWMSN